MSFPGVGGGVHGGHSLTQGNARSFSLCTRAWRGRRNGEELGSRGGAGGTRESGLSARSEQNPLWWDPQCVHTAPRKGNVSSYRIVGSMNHNYAWLRSH